MIDSLSEWMILLKVGLIEEYMSVSKTVISQVINLRKYILRVKLWESRQRNIYSVSD